MRPYSPVLKPVSTADYYEPRAGLSIGSLMKNPMFLLVAMTVLMAWLAPKMIEGMDPEALQEMQDQMVGKNQIKQNNNKTNKNVTDDFPAPFFSKLQTSGARNQTHTTRGDVMVCVRACVTD